MIRSNDKFFRENYDLLVSSVKPIKLDEYCQVSYEVCKHKTGKEYHVWLLMETDMTDMDMGIVKKRIKSVQFTSNEVEALKQAFKKYIKRANFQSWWSFRFGKDHSVY